MQVFLNISVVSFDKFNTSGAIVKLVQALFIIRLTRYFSQVGRFEFKKKSVFAINRLVGNLVNKTDYRGTICWARC
jgi:hypothetical protein